MATGAERQKRYRDRKKAAAALTRVSDEPTALTPTAVSRFVHAAPPLEGRVTDGSDLMAPAVALALEALDPPDADAAFAQVARMVAADIDSMPRDIRDVMFPQHAGILMRAMDGLEKRAKERRKPGSPGRRGPNELDKLRAARAQQRKGA